ncbi:MAG: 30S ribosomal protein S16 [Candidatus Paceibacterota bacterium]|jgi:small subunit ribosomal protein S16
MLIIRLQRVGRRNEPTFRIVVTDSKNGPKSGKALEVVGAYDPREAKGNKGNNRLDTERIKHWISKGAQVSDTVHNMLISAKVIQGKKINVLPKKKPIVKEEKPVEKKAVPPAGVTPAPSEVKAEAPTV